jgi:hypothetical protein
VIESHVRMQIDQNTGAMTHGADSWATIPGLGSFDASGTFNLMTKELDLALSGEDTLTFQYSLESDCLAVEIDGEAIKFDLEDAPVCED